jgi:hypothetical protein
LTSFYGNSMIASASKVSRKLSACSAGRRAQQRPRGADGGPRHCPGKHRDKARAFRADPEVQEALRASRAAGLSEPTLSEGETWRDVRDFTVDADALGARGMGYERLDQLALEHLYGVR